MIDYETVNSSFFRAHKLYCETIESKLKTLSIDCSGYCNGFGYELTTKFERNNLKFDIKFIKYQTTQNGIFIPIDAHEYTGIRMIILGLKRIDRLTVGKSTLLRKFCSIEIKEKISKPYYIKLRNNRSNSFIDNLIKIIEDNHFSKIRIKNGKLTAIIHESTSDPVKLINDIEYIIKNVP